MCNELTLFVCNKYVLINTKTKKSLLSHSHQVEHVDLFDDGHEAVTATAVQHRLPERAFAVWDVASHAWCVPGGDYRIEVGASSRDLATAGTITG